MESRGEEGQPLHILLVPMINLMVASSFILNFCVDQRILLPLYASNLCEGKMAVPLLKKQSFIKNNRQILPLSHGQIVLILNVDIVLE